MVGFGVNGVAPAVLKERCVVNRKLRLHTVMHIEPLRGYKKTNIIDKGSFLDHLNLEK